MPSDTSSFRLRFAPWLILAGGLALTYVLQDLARQHDEETARDAFELHVDEVADSIERRLRTYEQALEGTASLFAASSPVERQNFAAYVGALHLGEKYPGIQGIGFSRQVPAAEKERHIAAVRGEGFPDYALLPPGKRDPYTAIVFLEPFDWRNRRAFGFDMYSEPVRRAAMEHARDNGRTAISGKVRLVQETEQDAQPGFLMYLPVYRPHMPRQTTAERRANLLGWVYAPFRMNDLMAGALGRHFGELGTSLDLRIHDGETTATDQLLFASTAATGRSGASPASALHSVRPLDLFDHRWTLSVRSLPAFEARIQNHTADSIAAAGAAGSMLLALVAWLLVTARARALVLARAMTVELRQSEANKNALFENMSSGVAIFRVDGDGRDFIFTGYNRAAERMDRLSRTEVLGCRIEEVLPGVVGLGLPEVFRRVWRSGVAEECPAAFYRDARIAGWRETFVYKLPDDSLVAMTNDVSARKQAELAKEKLNRALRLLSDCNTALVHADDEYRLLAEICRLIVERGGYLLAWVGYAERDEACTVRPIAQSGYETGYLDSVHITWANDEHGQGPTGTAIRTGKTEINQNCLHNPRMAPWRDAALRRGYQSSIALPLCDDGQVLGALNMYSREPDAFNAEEVRLLEELANDLAYGIVTLRTRAEHAAAKERVSFLANFDALTHLPNRMLLRDRFEHAALVAESQGSLIGMLHLGVDNFKQINDGYGLDTGDRLLVEIVQRLRRHVPATETICRLGGDEFVVLLTGIRDSAAVASAAGALLDAFVEPVSVDGKLLNTSFSIGISLFPDDGRAFDTLLKRADTALNSAKESGRNAYRFYTRAMNTDAQERMRYAGQLLAAVRNREFVVHYQPQVAVDTGRIVGVEALVRWQHPTEGLLAPGRFIALAEQSGHIVQIGEWVLGEACRQARAWLDRGLPPLLVAVNLSAVQFKRGNVLEIVSAALAESGLPPDRLELELTESVLLQDAEATIVTLQKLKALGIKLSIDDFGTGYSSLSYLKRLAVDKLKIDQSFVRDMLTDADGASIVKAIIQLGHTLQLTVIAEGVETEAQLAFLGGSGCDEAQGYLYSRPVSAARFADLLEQETAGIA